MLSPGTVISVLGLGLLLTAGVMVGSSAPAPAAVLPAGGVHLLQLQPLLQQGRLTSLE